MARSAGAITLDFKNEDIYDRIQDLTQGRGADACIDAVGTEPDTSSGFDAVVDRVKVATFLGTDRPHVLRQAIYCCHNFGTVSIVGVYGGFVDKIPIGSAINRGLTFRMAQTPVQRYLPILMERIEKGEICRRDHDVYRSGRRPCRSGRRAQPLLVGDSATCSASGQNAFLVNQVLRAWGSIISPTGRETHQPRHFFRGPTYPKSQT
jgi:hypothetical protein